MLRMVFTLPYALFVLLLWQHSELCSGQIRFPSPGQKEPMNHTADTSRNCTDDEVFFGGQCFPEFTKGHPCPEGKWLVKSASNTSHPNGDCQQKPCPPSKFLWTIRGATAAKKVCDSRDYGSRMCSKEFETGFISEYDGTGICDCMDGTVYWQPTDTCYPLLAKGPCREGEILFYDPKNKFLACQRNPCNNESEIIWSDGQCYKPGYPSTEQPCQQNARLRLKLNPASLEIECSAVHPSEEERTLIQLIPKRRNCKSEEPGVALSLECAGNKSISIQIGFSSGCEEKGYIRNPHGGCTKWISQLTSSTVAPSSTTGVPSPITQVSTSSTGAPPTTTRASTGTPLSAQVSTSSAEAPLLVTSSDSPTTLSQQSGASSSGTTPPTAHIEGSAARSFHGDQVPLLVFVGALTLLGRNLCKSSNF